MKETRVSPSKLDLLSLCHASAKECAPLPWESSPAAERGKDLHERMALLMRSGESVLPHVLEGLNQDDQEAVKMAWSVVTEGDILPPEPRSLFIEHKVDLSFLGMKNGGTLDVGAYHPESGVLLVLDWKFGRTPVEDPRHNLQLKAYALGLWDELNAKGELPEVALLCVVQPGGSRVESFRSAEVALGDLKDERPELEAIVKAALGKDPEHIPGPWCRGKFCGAAKAETCQVFLAWRGEKEEQRHEAKVEEAKLAVVSGFRPVQVDGIPGPLVVLDESTLERAEALRARASELVVVDATTAQAAALLQNEVTKFESQVKTSRLEVTRPLDELKKRIIEAADQALAPLAEAKAKLSGSQVSYKRAEDERVRAEQEAKRREEQAANEARLKAEREAKEAEQAAANAKNKAERERLQKEAEEKKKAQAEAEAQAERAREVKVAAPAKVKGVSFLEELVSFELDFEAVPREFLMPNEQAIRAAIKAQKWGAKDGPKAPNWIKTTVWEQKARGTGRSK